jgi:hypothetical protein
MQTRIATKLGRRLATTCSFHRVLGPEAFEQLPERTVTGCQISCDSDLISPRDPVIIVSREARNEKIKGTKRLRETPDGNFSTCKIYSCPTLSRGVTPRSR